MIVSTVVNGHVPLCVAATHGNTAMVEFLVKDCRANVEGEGDSCVGTPLWCAAIQGRLEVVKLLQELGADMNAVSKSKLTSVNYACCAMEIETVKFLVKQGADINRPNERDETCLMHSVPYLELCRFLIDNGAEVNAQDNFGNTALHYAITGGYLETVELLLDRDSDQNIKNNQGDDALQLASLHGKDSIVMELEARLKPTPSRLFKSLQLLGSYCLLFSEAGDVRHALVYWRRSVTLRMMNPCVDSRESESSPVSRNTKEVNTLEELEELCQDEEMVHMYAIENMLRIISPSHKETTDGLVRVSKVFAKNGKYRQSFDLLKYAFQLLQTFTADHICLLDLLYWTCWSAVHQSEFVIEFQDVLEILDMVSLKAQFAEEMNEYENSLVGNHILLFIKFVIELDKSPDQMDSFKFVVHRLVHSQMKAADGRTFLHRAVELCCLAQGCLGVVEVLLECGADDQRSRS